MPILDDLQRAVSMGRYRVSEHALDKMRTDNLHIADVLEATLAGEAIEDYPKAFPYPACLILGRTGAGEPVHVVWAFDAQNAYSVMVTVYRPDPTRWSADFRKRVSHE